MFRNDIDRESGMYHLKSYLKDVGLDFADIFTLNVGAGKAGPFLLHGNVHATKYAELGWGSWSGYKAGLLGRAWGIWREERHLGYPLPSFALLPVQNYHVTACRIPYCGTKTLADKAMSIRGYDINLDENRHWSDLGFSLHVIGVGLDAGLSPYEAVDFVLGFFGNYPNLDWMAGSDMPWDIGHDVADDDTRVSIYDDKLNRYRSNSYSMWPTVWPTTYEHHEEMEGEEWDYEPYRGPETISVGGAWGGTHSKHDVHPRQHHP